MSSNNDEKEKNKKVVRTIKIAYHPDRFDDKKLKEAAHQLIYETDDKYNKKWNNKKKGN